jgi:ACR3 family arsenite efflux pump ArsB
VNFVLVPLVVWPLSQFVAHDQALLVGVLLVLLTPCIDYVLVFTGLAGGARTRLLAATPLLMLVQIILLPVLLRLLAGPEAVAGLALEPFVRAFLTFIVVPLLAAALTRAAAARVPWVDRVAGAVEAAMVPLMMATLALAVASQIGAVSGLLGSLLLVVPVFVVFAVIMLAVGIAAGRLAGLDVPATRALALSGVTRNSLVVLPLALATPFALAPLVVVTQTLVELLFLVGCVRLLPRLVPAARGPS